MKKGKKKILFVMNNMCMGGIQKALVSLLNTLCADYDITVLLFWKYGSLIDEIPSSVKVIETKSMYRFIGMSQQGCAKNTEKAIRGGLVVLTRLLGRSAAIKLMQLSLKQDKFHQFDLAVSYSHCQAPKMFYAGTAEYVLSMKDVSKKICYIHCDYEHSGTECKENNDIYRKFDNIVCVSESVRAGLLRVLPDMKEKTVAFENPINKAEILQLADVNQFKYDDSYVNILSVARICREKGIERVITALGGISLRNFRYYIVGDGDRRNACEELVKTLGLTENIVFLGEDANPYKYMINADFLIVPSYHEAAPVVFQEAKLLGLPVLTTRTLSAAEMIGERYGWVVDNEDAALEEKLLDLLKDRSKIDEKKHWLKKNMLIEKDAIGFYESIV